MAGTAYAPRWPVFADHAAGAHVWDVDGNRYLDLTLGFGSVILGHANPEVTAAVVRELTSGIACSLHKPLQLDLIDDLCRVVPHVESAMLLRTGSDATDAAVRIARAATGRQHVLRWGYNGWHDWCAERPAGLGSDVQRDVDRFGYNDLDGLRGLIRDRGAELACVIMMPYEFEAPAEGYLAAAADLVRGTGGLFILDEVRSGFRLALGGAQEYFGVRADLVALSKAMANGFTISAVAGRRDVMEVVPQISLSSTFFRHTEAMAAARVTIAVLERDAVPARIWQLGTRLWAALSDVCAQTDGVAVLTGMPPTPFIRFDVGSAALEATARAALVDTALADGVLLLPDHHWFLCAAMTEDDIDRLAEVINSAVSRAIASLP